MEKTEVYKNAIFDFLTELDVIDKHYKTYAQIDISTKISDELEFSRSGRIANIYERK